MDANLFLRKELDRVLSGQGAHLDFSDAVRDWPAELRGARHADLPHSAWELVEHLRIAQWDMLEFSRNAGHVSPEWPEDYWPGTPEPPDADAWDRTIAAFEADRAAMRALVADPASDLFTPFAHGEGQSLLREAIQVADHNAYHVGQLASLRKALGI